LPVIIISAYGDVPMAVRAMQSGAVNFLEKPCREHELWEAIREALQRDSKNRRKISQEAAIRSRLARLTAGEREVLDRLVGGMSNRAIAEELGLSVRTIEVRRHKLMKKTKAGSLAELVSLAVLVHPECGAPQPASGSLQ
jgi:RNA polymerase sigma factor (sigma-70 family)